MRDFLNKETIITIIFFVFVLPTLINHGFSLLKILENPSQENIDSSVELVAQSQMPWWISVIEWLVNIKSGICAFLIIGFVYLLKFIGEI